MVWRLPGKERVGMWWKLVVYLEQEPETLWIFSQKNGQPSMEGCPIPFFS